MFILTAPGAVLVYVVYRLLIGRPLQRQVLNVVSSLILLVFFLITAGVGIFWVANQELPVFDIHYLFGYATLVLVLIHVTLNWRSLAAFFRRLTPKPLLEEGGRTWRPTLRITGWIIGLALLAGISFWLGLRRGASRIEITMPEPSAVSLPSAAGSTPGPSGANTSSPRSEVPAVTDLPDAPPARHQVVKHAEKERILADYYHERTKHSRLSVMAKSGGIDWSTQPKVFKEYPDAEVVKLPKPHPGVGMSTGAAIETSRRPMRGLLQDAVSLTDLSTLLYMTNGITDELRYPGITYYLRAAPSAGALYPIVTYVLVRNVSDLQPGLYHYAVNGHRLHRLRGGQALNKDLAALVAHSHFVENAPVTLMFSAIYFRSSWKYGERSYRYCLLDAGHLAVQAALAANGLGYSSKLIGRFEDSKVNAFLTLDEEKEGTLLILPVGKPSQQPTAPPGQIAFVTQPKKILGDGNQLLLLMHGRTYFGLAGGEVSLFPPRNPGDKSYPDLSVIRLPKEFPEGDDIVPTILRRRSARNWANRGMTIPQLASVLYHALGISEQKEGSLPDPSIEDNQALNLYLLVNDVQGLDPGIYYYRRHDHALSRIRKGDYRTKSYEMSLFQRVVGDSGVAIIMTIDLERFGYPDADRGYRYAAMDAGMLGGRLYLQTVALGLGCTGIGAFFDNEVSHWIDVSPTKELVVYTAAIGVKAQETER